MGEQQSHLETARQTVFRITAYVSAKLRRRDLRAEVDRLETQPRTQSWGETALTLAMFLVLAIIAASFGWVGLSLYFLAALVLFY